MTLQDLLNDCEARLGDTNYQLASQANLTLWLNMAQQDLGEYANVPDTYTFSSQSGVQSYALPSDCLKPRSLTQTLTQGKQSVKYLSLDEWEAQDDAMGLPQGDSPIYQGILYYTTWGSNMLILPVPTRDGSNDMTLRYYRQVTDLSNLTDVSDIPYPFVEALSLYAVARANESVEEWQSAQYFMSQYDVLKQRLQQQRSSLNRDRPPRSRVRKYDI